ncbi:unnamed protein product [Paramecium sonneborni]|uniref:Cytochrome P450 n=1 Tax=Paramecium sonneborni TaxID=65129 RepID=A0A8S1PK20_9CILI|nr:unnamed protein product [Paramecium sonneborni]
MISFAYFAILTIVLIAIILYFIAIKPIIEMIKLKLQFGNDCKISFNFLGKEIYDQLKETKENKNENDIFNKQKTAYNKYQYKFFTTNMLWIIRISIADPLYQKAALQNHHFYQKVDPVCHKGLLSKGLVFSKGEQWKKQRLLLSKLFEFDSLKQKVPMINEITKNKLSNFSNENILSSLQSITGLIVIKSFFGIQTDQIYVNNTELQVEIANIMNEMGFLRFKSSIQSVKRLIFGTKAWKILPTKEEVKLLHRVDIIRSIVGNLVQQRINYFQNLDDEQKKISENDNFLNVLVSEYLKINNKQQQEETFDQIIQEFITLQFAGTDTTAVLLYHCLYFFACNPQAQEEIRSEINQFCPSNFIQENQINNLKRLQAFINEVLRLKNPAMRPIIRVASQDHNLMDLKIKKGWLICIDYFLQNQSEKHFDQAGKFDYTRWMQDKPIKEDNNFIYMPFSAGPRNCIGSQMAQLETKIILGQILKNYHIIENKNVIVSWVIHFNHQLSPTNAVILKKIQ